MSVNICGLSNYMKRHEVYSRIFFPVTTEYSQRPAIIALQETKLSQDNIALIEKEIAHIGVHISSQDTAGGLSIFIDSKWHHEIHHVVKDPEGAFIVLDISLGGSRMTVVNSYFKPILTISEAVSKWNEIIKVVSELNNSKTIWMGDFNMALSEKDCPDSRSDGGKWRKISRGKQWSEVMELFELTDVWALLNPNDPGYTYRCSNNSRSRLDYIFCTPDVLPDICKCIQLPVILSDHRALVIQINTSCEKRGRGCWKFPNFLLNDNAFVDKMAEHIDMLIECNSDAHPALLWDTVKAGIRGLAIKHIAYSKRNKKNAIEDIERKIAEMTIKFNHATAHYDRDSLSKNISKLQHEHDELYKHCTEGARIYNQTRSFYETDRYSKHFMCLGNKNRGYIKKLLTVIEVEENEVDGISPHSESHCMAGKGTHINKVEKTVEITDPKEILNVCAKSLKDQFTPPLDYDAGNPTLLAKYLNNVPGDRMDINSFKLLDAPITMAEMYEALKHMKRDASPGSDGITVNFYIKFWPNIKILVYNSLMHAEMSGQMSVSQRRSLITLLPKKDKIPNDVKNLRPITLLNVDYKILTKALALRLQKVLPMLVHEDQKGFVQNRNAKENVLDVYEYVTWAQTHSSQPWALLVCDIAKAFDSVLWSFLEEVMHAFAFPHSFISWVKIINNNKEIRVTNNGYLSTPFSSSCGTAQGCSLSPLLFVLAIEVLAIAIRRNGHIQGFKTEDLVKKLNMLADDVLVAFKATPDALENLDVILHEFGIISNLKLNRDKTIYVPLTKSATTGNRCTTLQVKSMTDGCFGYLGMSISTTNDKTSYNYDALINSVSSMISCWKATKKTSLLGRINLVKAHIAQRFVYPFSLSCPPKSEQIKYLQKLCNDFIWGSSRHGIGEKYVYLPLSQGGLAAHNVTSQLHSLQMAWIPCLLSDTKQFWKSSIKSKFCVSLKELALCNAHRRSNIPFLKSNAHLSRLWYDIFHTWYLETYIPASHPDRDKTQIMGNNVLKTKTVHDVNLCNRLKAKNIVTISDFQNIPQGLPRENRYLTSAVRNLPPPVFTDNAPPQSLKFFVVNTIPPPKTNLIRRALVQMHSGNENPRISSWENELECDMSKMFDHLCKVLKNITCISLRSFHVRFINRTLLSNRTLFIAGKLSSPNCSFCKSVVDSRLHSFWECDHVKPVWQKVIKVCKSMYPHETYNAAKCLVLGFSKPILNNIMIICKYCIHLAKIFNRKVTFDEVVTSIVSYKARDYKAYSILPYININGYFKRWLPIGLKDFSAIAHNVNQ